MAITIVVLGASYAGLLVSHRLLKYGVSATDVNVVLVSPSQHLYWNIASVRAIIPDAYDTKSLFQDFLPGFSQYASGSFEFVQGRATAVDADLKAVEISTAGGLVERSYDHLIIATGTSCAGEIPWKAIGTRDDTLTALLGMQQQITAASSIVIAGAGPTGVETAGELGHAFGATKSISLITSRDQVLPGTFSPAGAAEAQSYLEDMRVKVVTNSRVASSTKLADGRTELTLSDGSTMTTDVYIPAVGMKANTGFLPQRFLDDRGRVLVDDTFAVTGTDDMWAIGDVIGIERSLVRTTDAQGRLMVKNIALTLAGKPLQRYKIGTDMISMTVGPKRMMATIGSFKIPTFVMRLLPDRNFGISFMPRIVNGSFV